MISVYVLGESRDLLAWKVGHDGKNFQLVPSDPLTKCMHGRSSVVLGSPQKHLYIQDPTFLTYIESWS